MWSTFAVMQKILQKKANRNIIIFICMVLIALLCRILGKISFQYVLNGIVRSIIYIGLYIGWAISIHKRVVQKSVKNTLLLISGLMIFWFIIRTIKYFFNRCQHRTLFVVQLLSAYALYSTGSTTGSDSSWTAGRVYFTQMVKINISSCHFLFFTCNIQ